MAVLIFGFILLSLVIPSNAIIQRKLPDHVRFRGGETRNRHGEENQLVGSKPNPWVEASSLIVAASTKNGVALVAIHNVDSTVNGTEDWLNNYKEQLRIQTVDSIGTAIMSAGWRPDAQWLADQCRKLAAQELDTFGSPPASSTLAQDLSLWMAECTISSKFRVPCAVCLLASRDGIWLVDPTGAYRARAHAIGKGATIINSRLCKVDFSKLTPEEGLDRLIKLLLQEGEEGWESFSKDTPIESAIIDSNKKKLRRIASSFATA